MSFTITVDPEKYPHLSKTEIRSLVKEQETHGAVVDYITLEAERNLEDQNFEKGAN